MNERRDFLQAAILAESARLLAGAAKLEADEIMIEVRDLLDVFDLPTEVPGAKRVSRRGGARGRRVEGCQ